MSLTCMLTPDVMLFKKCPRIPNDHIVNEYMRHIQYVCLCTHTYLYVGVVFLHRSATPQQALIND